MDGAWTLGPESNPHITRTDSALEAIRGVEAVALRVIEEWGEAVRTSRAILKSRWKTTMPKNRLNKFVNSRRHAAECKIYAHAQRQEIEREFINWQSPASIAKQYGLRNRSTVYQHAHAMGLFRGESVIQRNL